MNVCEICQERLASHTHHRKRRAQGGDNSPENLMRLCFVCHGRVHSSPKWAYERGYLVRGSSTVTPLDAAPDAPTSDSPSGGAQHREGEKKQCPTCKGEGEVEVKPKKPTTERGQVTSIRAPKGEKNVLPHLISEIQDEVQVRQELEKRPAPYASLVAVLHDWLTT